MSFAEANSIRFQTVMREKKRKKVNVYLKFNVSSIFKKY